MPLKSLAEWHFWEWSYNQQQEGQQHWKMNLVAQVRRETNSGEGRNKDSALSCDSKWSGGAPGVVSELGLCLWCLQVRCKWPQSQSQLCTAAHQTEMLVTERGRSDEDAANFIWSSSAPGLWRTAGMGGSSAGASSQHCWCLLHRAWTGLQESTRKMFTASFHTHLYR